MVLFASAACAQTASPVAKDLGPPFSVLGDVRLGMSPTALEAERPGVEGKPEYGMSEQIDGRKTVYFFEGEYGGMMVFLSEGLEAVIIGEELPEGPIPAARFEEFRRLGGDVPFTCAISSQNGTFWYQKTVGESAFTISVTPMILLPYREVVDTTPRRLVFGWLTKGYAHSIPDRVATSCPQVDGDLPP